MKPAQENDNRSDDADAKKPAIDHSDKSGTDPNRYAATPGEKTGDASDYNKAPENHPDAEDRLLHPDKGESEQ